MGREVVRNWRMGKYDQNIFIQKFSHKNLLQLYNMSNCVSLKLRQAGFLFLVAYSEINGVMKTSINDHFLFLLQKPRTQEAQVKFLCRYTIFLFPCCFFPSNQNLLKILCRFCFFSKNDVKQKSASIHFQVPTAAVIRQTSPQMTLKAESQSSLSFPQCPLKSNFPSFDHINKS